MYPSPRKQNTSSYTVCNKEMLLIRSFLVIEWRWDPAAQIADDPTVGQTGRGWFSLFIQQPKRILSLILREREGNLTTQQKWTVNEDLAQDLVFWPLTPVTQWLKVELTWEPKAWNVSFPCGIIQLKNPVYPCEAFWQLASLKGKTKSDLVLVLFFANKFLPDK